MNCKPGDLAIRIKGADGHSIPLGAIVKCIKFFPGLCFGVNSAGESVSWRDAWHVEWNGEKVGATGLMLGIPDEHLRPIRDPGEDAQDETLNWPPSPSRDEVTA